MKKILFTGGGSAGHVIPNVALIEELLSSGEADVAYMGTDGIEKSIIAPYKIPYMQITCPKLIRGGGWSALKNNLKIPFAFALAVRQAKDRLQLYRPDVVFSKGGFVGLPVVFAAKKLGIPCFAHESDLSVGLANKLSAKKCRFVFTSFPETANFIKNGKYSGAPLRRKMLCVDKADARKRLGFSPDEKILLIFGGGSGSEAINSAVRQHLSTLTKRYTILHICGKGKVVKSTVKNYRQIPFIADMGTAFACADGIIARAGAGTIFEIIALKKPALLVPLSAQTRGDQKQNADYFLRKGLCRVLAQENLQKLPEEVDKLFADKHLFHNLSTTSLLCGNDTILRELRKWL